MSRYLVTRLLNMIPLIVLATMISFGIMQAAPGGPQNVLLATESNSGVDPQQIEALKEKWGLNDPMYVQYYRWITNVATGDFGMSYYYKKPVIQVMGTALGNTLQLSLVAVVISYVIALPLGVISAVRQYSKLDMALTSVAFAGQAAPAFWIALLLIWGVAMHSGGAIPTNGIATAGLNIDTNGLLTVIADRAKYMLLPLIVTVFGSLTALMRFMRASMLEVLKEDYIRTARSKGLKENVVVYRHAMRNALLPIIALSGGLLAGLVGGSVIIETIFSWPGMGRVAFEAVNNRDYNVSMAIMLMGTVLTLIGLFLVDIAYVIVDPRIKYD
ncbi:MAG TPA: ABC transporter permease [Symbiobacteriaceae bacterium]|nr:ABC transporter permease [Symbiobacteriaceae bacterium]